MPRRRCSGRTASRYIFPRQPSNVAMSAPTMSRPSSATSTPSGSASKRAWRPAASSVALGCASASRHSSRSAPISSAVPDRIRISFELRCCAPITGTQNDSARTGAASAYQAPLARSQARTHKRANWHSMRPTTRSTSAPDRRLGGNSRGRNRAFYRVVRCALDPAFGATPVGSIRRAFRDTVRHVHGTGRAPFGRVPGPYEGCGREGPTLGRCAEWFGRRRSGGLLPARPLLCGVRWSRAQRSQHPDYSRLPAGGRRALTR
jgi:hypothetical protein